MRSSLAAAAVLVALAGPSATPAVADGRPPVFESAADGDVLGEIALVDADGATVERVTHLGEPTDLSWLRNGHLLVVDRAGGQLVEVDLEGALHWQWRSPPGGQRPEEASELESGNLLVAAGRDGAFEVDRSGAVVWRVDGLELPVNSAIRRPDGSTLLVTRDRDRKLLLAPAGGGAVRELAFPAGEGVGYWTRGAAWTADGAEFLLWDIDWTAIYRATLTDDRVVVLAADEMYRLKRVTPDGAGGFVFTVEFDLVGGHWRPGQEPHRFPLLFRPNDIVPGPGPDRCLVAYRRQPDVSWPESRPGRQVPAPVDWKVAGRWALGGLVLAAAGYLLVRWRGPGVVADTATAPIDHEPQTRRATAALHLAVVVAATLGVALAAVGNERLRDHFRPGWLPLFAGGAVLAAAAVELWRRRALGDRDPFWSATIEARTAGAETTVLVGAGVLTIAGCALLYRWRTAGAPATDQAGLWFALVGLMLGLGVLSALLPWRRPRPADWRFWAAMTVPLGIASVTLFYRLDDIPGHLHFDNVYYASAALRLIEGRFASIWDFGFVPGPLIGLLPPLAGFALAGPGELGFRLGSALYGLSGIVAVALLGRCYRDRRTGILAAIFLAGSVPYIHHVRTGANGDAAVAALWMLTLFALAVRRGSPGLWILAGLAAGYTFYLWVGARVVVVSCAVGGLVVGARSPRTVARRWLGLALMVVAFAVWIVPLVPMWVASPEAMFPRAQESLEAFKPRDGFDWQRTASSFGMPLARSFGWFFVMPDNSSHGTISPGCNDVEAVLLAVGLVIAMTEGFSLNVVFLIHVFIVLLTMGAFAGSPPWYTRMLPTMPVAAVLMARATLALVDVLRGRPGPRRALPVALAVLLVIVAGPVANMVTYSRAELTGAGAAPFPSMTSVGRRLRELDPKMHHYLVVTGSPDWSADGRSGAATFGVLKPYVWDLHVSEVREPETILPLDADEGATFSIQPDRLEQDVAKLRRWYPNARVEELYARKGFLSAGLVIVDREQVRAARTASGTSP